MSRGNPDATAENIAIGRNCNVGDERSLVGKLDSNPIGIDRTGDGDIPATAGKRQCRRRVESNDPRKRIDDDGARPGIGVRTVSTTAEKMFRHGATLRIGWSPSVKRLCD